MAAGLALSFTFSSVSVRALIAFSTFSLVKKFPLLKILLFCTPLLLKSCRCSSSKCLLFLYLLLELAGAFSSSPLVGLRATGVPGPTTEGSR